MADRADRLAGTRVAFLATDGVEQVELTEPWRAVEEAGGEPVLLSLRAGEIQGYHGLDAGDRFRVDQAVRSASPEDFAALVLPGGVANPDRLRTDRDAVAFVRAFMDSGKPVAAICHGPWLLVEAGAVKGRTLTSWPSLRTDIENAGGTWVDREVQVEQGLITSRKPEDLAAFGRELVNAVARTRVDVDESLLDYMNEQSFPASDPLPPPSRLGGQPVRGGVEGGRGRTTDRGEPPARPGR